MKASIWVGLTTLGMAALGILLPVLLGENQSARWRPVALNADNVVIDEPPKRLGETAGPQPQAQSNAPWLTRIVDKVVQPVAQRRATRFKHMR